MTTHPYTAIVFDFGGVIELRDGPDLLSDIASAIGVPVTNFKSEYFKQNHKSNIQNIPWEHMILDVVSVFDTSEEAKQKTIFLREKYMARKSINTELVSFFPRLRSAGYQVAILSNATSGLRDKLKENGIAQLVDEIVISGEIGFQKPHREVFDILFRKLAVKPEEVIFIDDASKSLEKAGEIGYTPILFKDNETLFLALNQLGIHV